MKKMKRAIISLFVVLLFINFVYAADILNNSKNATIDFKGKSNEVLEKEVKIPDNLQIVARVLFGLKEGDKVDFQTFVLLFATFFIILILLHEIISVMFRDWKSWVFAIIVNLIIGISGGFREAIEFFFGIGNLFGFLEEYELLRFIIVLVLLFVLFYLLSKVFNKFKDKEELEESGQMGRDIGFMVSISRAYRKIMGKNS